MSEIYIHIGLPKTATTFMQHKIFPAYPGVFQLQKAKSISIDDLVRCKASKFLISSEHLLACPFEKKDGDWHQEFEKNLENLANIFPTARIILSLTNHKSLLTSYYKEYISKPRPFYMSINEFFGTAKNDGFLKHNDLLFYNILKLIEKHFSQTPFVFLQSEIRTNFDNLITDLSDYFEEPNPEFDPDIKNFTINESVKHYQAKLLIFLNRCNNILEKIPLLPSLYNPVFMKLGVNPDRLCRIHFKSLANKPLELTSQQKQFIAETYKNDWDSVQKHLISNRKHFKN